MYNNRRKTIGVFICRTAHHFQRTLCRGIIEQAYKLGFNVAFFSSFGNYSGNELFSEGEKQIAKLPDYDQLAGVILALDTFDIKVLKDELIETCKKQKCPVVCIREEVEGLYNFNVDEETCMEGVIRHFIEEHKYRDICFLTGRKGEKNAEARLACFRRIMKENDVPVNEKLIRYGKFWKDDGVSACKQFIDDYGKIPEAIICANDYMAISVCNELIERGIRISEDVAVCGYDGIWETMICAPSVTTVEVPVFDMGMEAVSLIDRVGKGIKCEKRKLFDVNLVLNESCGCVEANREEILINRKDFYNKIERREANNYQSTFMTIDLEEITSLRQLARVIEKYIGFVGNYNSFHMCFCDGIHDTHIDEAESYTDEMRLYLTMERGHKVNIANEFFDKKQLLPDSVISEDPQVYFFLPLHFKERCFGYTAINFQDSGSYGQNYQSWMVNLGNSIEDIYVRKKMQQLIDHLEDMYVRDVLTGLFNRRGFDKFGHELFEKAKKEGNQIYVIMMDLDGLKLINDNFGHPQGDIAIKTVAEAIREAAVNGEICARMGGDEFCVLGTTKEDVQEKVDKFFEHFDKNMHLVNEAFSMQYKVGASYGVSTGKPNQEEILESYMNKSDSAMYEMKAMRKRGVR